ncbi:MAG: hypothetical protein ACLP01_13720 [Solirubrobacteraceae bacterium]
MLSLLKSRRARSGEADRNREAGPVTEPVIVWAELESPSRGEHYLTDGVELYRLLGRVARGACELVGMENCRSLEIVLVPITDLRRGRLRLVPFAPREAAVASGA